jgi:hypothetical protein
VLRSMQRGEITREARYTLGFGINSAFEAFARR